MPRAVPFGDIVRGLTPFFVTRQIICGAGRVGMRQDGSRPGYQISQRADFFEAEVGLETTIRRPIINTRDEPHATADKYRRLHVIIGDANLSQVSNYLKFGTTALVLSLIEAGLAPKLEVHEPVAALQAVSHDTSLTATLRLLDGRRITALDLQWIYFEAAAKHAQDTGVADAVDGDGHTHEVLERWSATLTELGNDRAAAASSVEWLAKLSLLERLPGPRRTGVGPRAAGPRGPAVGGHPARKGALLPAAGTGPHAADRRRRRRSSGRSRSRRRTPGPTSGAAASAASGPTWSAPAGTP